MSTATARPTELWNGTPYPLGATWDGQGVNFSLYSRNAEKVELCLFDAAGKKETARLAFRERTDFVWHGYIPQLAPGQLYGYRVHGPYKPEEGHRFNPTKLLLDPYARAIVGPTTVHDTQFGYRLGGKREDLSFDRRDSAPFAPRGVVVDNAFDWTGDRRPKRACNERVIYEMHVGGYTRRHPEVVEAHRGKFSGLATRPVIEHLLSLGVTTVELLPVQFFIDDRVLTERGLVNYWGYNTIGFFAPASRYGEANAVTEFKAMVKALHAAGLEVILDVVYNHTAEGNQMGPTLSFRGVDHSEYYRLGDDRRYCADYTGCGNALDLRNPRVLQLVLDSLRYWATEMHVDGFRFDLATTLARESHGFDPEGRFLTTLRQDPILASTLLIAEPWDVGDGGYRVGQFPPGWAEWNDQYRDTMRAYWKGEGGLIGEFARRLTGSSDIFAPQERGPCASVNFITAHDGFTLQDLVSYNDKHNEANGEENRDGHSDNRSWNCGAEGPTDDEAVKALREQQKRNFMATLLLSHGVPMMLAGDELGRTQHGNNNAYCQDNETNWMEWVFDEPRNTFLDFVKRMIRLRREHPLFRRRRYLEGSALDGGRKDVTWLRPDGAEMTTEEWQKDFARCLGMWLYADHMPETDERGQPLHDATYLVIFNAHDGLIDFVLPHVEGRSWRTELDTRTARGEAPPELSTPSERYPVEGRTLVLLREVETAHG
jgi:glycogen operon protein